MNVIISLIFIFFFCFGWISRNYLSYIYICDYIMIIGCFNNKYILYQKILDAKLEESNSIIFNFKY